MTANEGLDGSEVCIGKWKRLSLLHSDKLGIGSCGYVEDNL